MWLSGWQYRKKITIQGSSGAGTNYQVLLKIGESSGATEANFHLHGLSDNFPSGKNQSGDLRLTSSDGSTLLNFWVEKVTGTSPNRVAYVWVKVSANLDTDKDIYIYFGNSSSSNVSNGDNTFLFFDDFDDSTINTSKWAYQGSVTEEDGYIKIVKNANQTTNLQVVNGITLTNYVVEYLASTSMSQFQIGVGIMDSNMSDGTGFWSLFNAGNSFNFIRRANSSWTYLQTDIGSFVTNSWYKYKIIKAGSNFSFYQENTQIGNTHTASVGSTTYVIFPRLWGETLADAGTIKLDDFRIRKFVSPEPAFSSAGALETLSSATRRRLLLSM